MPVLSALNGALAGGMNMHGSHEIYLDMQARSLPKWFFNWMCEQEDMGSPIGALTKVYVEFKNSSKCWM